MFKRTAGNRFAKNQKTVIIEHKSVLRTFTRAQHTVNFYSVKNENKQNSQTLSNWLSPAETRPVEPAIKYPIKHPKVVDTDEINDPKKERHLTVTLTHKLPKAYWQNKYDFTVLAYRYLGKDLKNPAKDHYVIVTSRVLTRNEVNTVPPLHICRRILYIPVL